MQNTADVCFIKQLLVCIWKIKYYFTFIFENKTCFKIKAFINPIYSKVLFDLLKFIYAYISVSMASSVSDVAAIVYIVLKM